MNLRTYLSFWTNLEFAKTVKKNYVKSIYDIDYQRLHDQGIRVLIYDYDDTLADFHGVLSEKTTNILHELVKMGFKIGLLSNFKPVRKQILIETFANIEIYIDYSANKPEPTGYLNILKYYNLKPNQACMVGDRVGTDIFGAHLAGIEQRVLVKPFSEVFGGKKAPLKDRIMKELEKMYVGV